MKSAAIREAFLSFFERQGHARVDSSSLVPGDDPTLLFTNAGMVQFKDVFLGGDKRPYVRATSSQRCVRAGGKHNDLENVGYTARHHTFFEMLGNFSFGDYFKRDAINFAWEFLTVELKIPAQKLWITVHISDDEAADIWVNEIGIDPARLSRLDEDNFWQMGDTGPCGPSSEIFYDHGPEVPGGPPGSPDDDLDRYIEIWNLVFMQFERAADGTMEPLPKPSIDTGMGLERIAAVMQGVHTNYEIDLFQNLLKAAASAVGTQDMESKSLRVIADHIRSCAFLITDGVMPGNEGRDYVLRRIMRRAIRHGHQLGQSGTFFHQLVGPLAKEMGEAYPELIAKQAQIEKVILAEEQQFARTLDNGMSMLNAAIGELEDKILPGELVFKLYDTYGFPVDLTNDVAREHGLGLDHEGFDAAMAKQRKRSQESGGFTVDYTQSLKLDGETQFSGYTESNGSGTITAILADGAVREQLQADDHGAIVLDSTPFYAESGGQAGDHGYLTADGLRFEVRDVTKSGNHFLHHGVVLEGTAAVGDVVTAQIDSNVRLATALNHSATHLLHAALRQVLGDHVTQKGSLVDADKLRFDFSHFEAVSSEQLQQIESMVNEKIRANTPVETDVTDMDTAKDKGAMALFGEKYGDEVRLLSMGDGFSVELCGGTHVNRTGDIGLLRIVSEGGISSGVRRIEGVTGARAMAVFDQTDKQLATIAHLVKGGKDSALAKVEQLMASHRQLEKDLDKLKAKLASGAGTDLASMAVEVNGVQVLAAQIDGADGKALRDAMDHLKNKLGRAVVVLAGVDGEKVSLVAGVTKAESGKLKAGDILGKVARQVGGKGGGRPDMAQGGGGDPALLADALATVVDWVAEHSGD
ncbi:MAG: alanine--tRNA ligase [Pseudomonadales bacterium]